MAVKPPRSLFVCQSCGYQTGKWLGKCPGCGAWNSLAEEVVTATSRRTGEGLVPGSGPPIPLVEVVAAAETHQPSGCSEWDRALGGGMVAGGVVLLGGEPGIGKSTLILQILDRLCGPAGRALYISGEESAAQLKLRADRLGVSAPGLLVAVETCLENILTLVETAKPQVLAVDSIQTLYSAALPAAPGSLGQVRDTAFSLIQLAKRQALPIFLIGHVTKEGAIAGPKLLEHMVDTVLYLEGDRSHGLRLLRTVKNRFGPTQELGVFDMQAAGMVEVVNASELFLAGRTLDTPGSVVVASIEGSRPLLVEVQALVIPSSLTVPRRQATGVDHGRLALLVAVLEKRLGLAFGNQDIFVNVAGGVRLTEPGVDLGVVAALLSSFLDRPLPGDTLVFGEVGLTGEVRRVTQADLRLKEGEKLGFGLALVPSGLALRPPGASALQLRPVANIGEFWQALFPGPPAARLRP